MIDGLERMTNARLFAAALRQVGAGTEAASFARQYHGAKAVFLFLDEVERGGGTAHQFRAGGVHRLGMIERQNSNIAVRRDIGPIEFRTHAHLLLVVTRAYRVRR